MIEEKKCLKCGKKEKVKNVFHRGKQRYKCKCCGYNYIGGRNGYPDHIKLRAIILFGGQWIQKNRENSIANYRYTFSTATPEKMH